MRRAAIPDRCGRLPPACFAPVMATGIVSRALAHSGAALASRLLLGVAVTAYLTLLAATLVKVVRRTVLVRTELREPGGLFGHFTFVAATGVLATRLGHGPARIAAEIQFAVAVVVWIALTVAAVSAVRSGARMPLRQADGTWFLATVGLQALVLTLLALRTGPTLLAIAVLLWETGLLLYGATLTAVILRLLRDPPQPGRLAPTYWVTMGAAAISTLTGTLLLRHEKLLPALARPSVAGEVVTLWAWATALIPVLLAAGVWRHVRHRVPLGYEPALWCVVFPLGMYATATAQLAALHRGVVPSAAVPLVIRTAAVAWIAVAVRCLTARAGQALGPSRPRPA
ncbi:tellurite resistance/C4-dicarboxylate transporter family protein [Streptomyces sp. NPDC056373]|uniref:tellurite resistance/C4-dicarboxylate transporter family protein n=1 Tax=Streptomyces sp. NPDC056373 TaxID=3345798 RepID=UPI0035DCFAA5